MTRRARTSSKGAVPASMKVSALWVRLVRSFSHWALARRSLGGGRLLVWRSDDRGHATVGALDARTGSVEVIGTGNGWYGEQTLDIEAVHAMAPGANVRYYGAASCYDDDLLGSLARVVADNDASVVTNSWGEPTFVNIPEIGCTP